jgi:hypothetical protein
MAFKNVRYAGSSYFDIGSGLLPFIITPTDATSVQAWAMLATDRVRADAFNLKADPESGAVAPGEFSRLRNLSGYTPQTCDEARSQLLGMQALMGALLGPAHPVVGTYGRFLWRYSRMLARLELEIEHVHVQPLGLSIMMFYVQLAWRNWMVVHPDSGETESIDPPDFGAGLSMLETQNNLMWLPSITNFPLLLSLSLGSHTRASTCGSEGTNGSSSPIHGAGTSISAIGGGGSQELLPHVAQSGTQHAMPCSPRTPLSPGISGPVA